MFPSPGKFSKFLSDFVPTGLQLLNHHEPPDAKKPADPSEDEFFRMFTRHQRGIYAFIRSMVPNSSDVDDLFQETSMRLWDQRAKYEPGSNFVAWACTIARYQVATYRKTKAREKLHYSDKFLEVVAARMEEEDLEARGRAGEPAWTSSLRRTRCCSVPSMRRMQSRRPSGSASGDRQTQSIRRSRESGESFTTASKGRLRKAQQP